MRSTHAMPAALRMPAAPAFSTAAHVAQDASGEPDGPVIPFSALRLLPRKLAACLLSVSVRKLDELTAAGKIRSVQIGDRRLYRPADLDAFVQAM